MDTIPALHGNWVDLIIILVILFFLREAWKSGFWVVISELLSLIGSFILASWAYKYISLLLRSNFSFSNSLSNAIGFLIAATIAEAVLSYMFMTLTSKIPKKYKEGRITKFLALIPALAESFVIVAFALTLFLGFPLLPNIKQDISESKIGGFLVKGTSGLEVRVKEAFGGIIEDSITYFTIKPGSHESVPISAPATALSVDDKSETAMFNLVNDERSKAGVKALNWDPNIVPVARAHAKDMWERHYFSHYSPEGKDVGDRLKEAKITYTFAGENLALAPTLATAHQGLMNSQGHRENILEPRFKKMGIGVIDNGIYGKMFVQVFTD